MGRAAKLNKNRMGKELRSDPKNLLRPGGIIVKVLFRNFPVFSIVKYLFLFLVILIMTDSLYCQLVQQDSVDYYGKALSAYNNRNYALAITFLDTLLMKVPYIAEGYYLRAKAHYDLKEFEPAIGDFSKAEELRMNSAELYYYRGLAYSKVKNYTSSLNDLKKAVEIDPEYLRAFIELGDIYYNLGDYHRALDYYNNANDIKPDFPPFLDKLGKTQIKLKAYLSAISIYQKAVKMDSLNSSYNNSLGLAFYFNGDSVSSLNYFNRAIAIDSNYAYALFNLARFYFNNNNFPLALKNYSKVIELDPPDLSDAELHKSRGQVYAMIRDYDHASKDFDLAINLDPKDTGTYLYRGKMYLELTKDSLALKDFEKIVELDSTNPFGYLYTGMVNYHFGKYDKAEKLLLTTLTYSPKDTMAMYTLANLYFDEQKYSDAIAYYTKALDANPNFKRIYLKRGSSYYNLGFYRQAAKDWDNAVRYEPSIYNSIKPLLNDARSKAGTKF